MTLTQGLQPSAILNRPVPEPWRRPSQEAARGRLERQFRAHFRRDDRARKLDRAHDTKPRLDRTTEVEDYPLEVWVCVPPRKRKRPTTAGQRDSNVQAYSVREFFAEFPNDDACLIRVMEVRYGLRHVCRKCGKDSTFHKLTNRKAFACSHCGDNSYPCASTIFQDSRTPLQTLFYVIYLFIATRHGVSGKELQRTLGVTYKTAYRIGMQIRDLMGKVDSFQVLKGHVEIDETYFGGYRPRSQGGKDAKTIIMGMKDAWKDHASGTTFSTNGTESFWKLFKDSVNSIHIHMSQTHLDRYLGEFSCRANFRQMKNAMFDLLVAAF
jgi:transposase